MKSETRLLKMGKLRQKIRLRETLAMNVFDKQDKSIRCFD